MKKKSTQTPLKHPLFTAGIISLTAVILLIIFSMVFYNIIVDGTTLNNHITYKQYETHYAFISDNSGDLFWDSIYEGAREQGEQCGTYVERFGQNMAAPCSQEELLEMAIASKVDGIIMRGQDTYAVSQLINEAVEKDIQVVTVFDDCIISTRCSNIGINNFKLGKEYANQLINYSDGEQQNIVVLIDSERADSNQNIIYQGITATLNKMGYGSNISEIIIDTKNRFSSEEIIRSLVMDSERQPDIIVCLSLMDTLCAYQSIVDFNKVGEIKILGYYTSETVLEALQKKIISATMVVDTKEMGRRAVKALHEYREYGRVSDYISVDAIMVNTSNIDDYIEKEVKREQYGDNKTER